MATKEWHAKLNDFDSNLEALVHKLLEDAEIEAVFHPPKIGYIRPETKHTYQPDFKIERGGVTYYVETKGIFRTRTESAKYDDIKASLPEKTELLFLFQNSNTPLLGAKRRKDGSRRTHGDWARDGGFRFFDLKNINDFLHLFTGEVK